MALREALASSSMVASGGRAGEDAARMEARVHELQVSALK